MGAKQSSPTDSPAANGRTRAYSGSDLPSSTSSSTVNRTPVAGVRHHANSGASGATDSNSQHLGARERSLGVSGGSISRPQSGIDIPISSGTYNSQESGDSSPEETGEHEGPRLLIGSLPAHLSPHLFGGKRTCSHRAGVTLVFFSVHSLD